MSMIGNRDSFSWIPAGSKACQTETESESEYSQYVPADVESTQDYFMQDIECQSADMLWKKAKSLSERQFEVQNIEAMTQAYLRCMADFCMKKEDYRNGIKFVWALAEYGGDAVYQNLMGLLYSRGVGVEKNNFAALYWFNKSEEQGNLEARENSDRIFQECSGILSREDFAEQIGMLAQWCRTGRGPVPLDRERGAYWTGRMEKILTGFGN